MSLATVSWRLMMMSSTSPPRVPMLRDSKVDDMSVLSDRFVARGIVGISRTNAVTSTPALASETVTAVSMATVVSQWISDKPGVI